MLYLLSLLLGKALSDNAFKVGFSLLKKLLTQLKLPDNINYLLLK